MARMVPVTDFGDFRRSALLERLRATEATGVFSQGFHDRLWKIFQLEASQRLEAESQAFVVFVM